MRKILCFLPLLLLGMTGCKVFESLFSTVHIAAGAEADSIRFYTRQSEFERVLRSVGTGEDITASSLAADYHSEARVIYSGFYTLSSPPALFPFIDRYLAGHLISYSFSLSSPRIFRGTLYNYPDSGSKSLDPMTVLLNSAFPPPPEFSRRMEYQYIEYNAMATIYFGYFGSNIVYGGIGVNFGQSRYNLQLLENNFRVGNTIGHWRAFTSIGVTLGYHLGRHFPKGIFSNTFIFVETANEITARHALSVALPRSDGSEAPPLYLSTGVVRFGIRKSIDLTEDGCDCKNEEKPASAPSAGQEIPGAPASVPEGEKKAEENSPPPSS